MALLRSLFLGFVPAALPVALAVLLGPTPARAEEAMDRATSALFGDTEARGLWFEEDPDRPNGRRHQFHVLSAKIERRPDGSLVVQGHIIHVKRTFDDQVNFSFTKHPNGKVTDFNIRVGKKRWKEMLEEAATRAIEKAAEALARKLGDQAGVTAEVLKEGKRLVGPKGWEPVAYRIITTAMLQAK